MIDVTVVKKSPLIEGNGFEARQIKGANKVAKIYVAQSFVLRPYTMHGLQNQNVSIG